MILLANILIAVAKILSSLIFVYTWIVIIACLISFVRPDPYNVIVRTLNGLTQPVFYWVRRKLPFLYVGGLDLSPIVVILALQFINIALVSSLGEFAVRLKLGA